MERLERIAEQIHQDFEIQTQARDHALSQARTLTRYCASAIRAVHRDEFDLAREEIIQASQLAKSLRSDLENHPDLYYAGYTQDALKEYAEANIFYALVVDNILPTPQELGIGNAAYLNGLAETVGEFRRRCLDILRQGYSTDAERLLKHMDEIYEILITMDYPNAITNGLRRQTDIVRGITERTRGDLTLSIRQEHLEQTMQRLEKRLEQE